MGTEKVIVIPYTQLSSQYDNLPLPTALHDQVILHNIVNTSTYPYSLCSIGGYIYRSRADDYTTYIPYNNHIKWFMEPNNGAHYYVMSGYTESYSKASAEITLSEISCDRAGHRNGFISLSIVCGDDGYDMRQCDIGLGFTVVNGVAGWYPTSWSRNYNSSTIENLPVDTDFTTGFNVGSLTGTKITASKVRIEIHVKYIKENGVIYDAVEGYIYNCANNQKIAKIRYKAAKGSYFVPTGHSAPYVRFTRFMSLVPVEKNEDGDTTGDYKDDSRLTGVMRNCKLDSTPWTKELIAFAWSAQGINITDLQIGDLSDNPVASDADRCIIYHHYATHEKP